MLPEGKWLLDSGATSHMTGSKELLVEMRPNNSNTNVSYGDKSSFKVLGFTKVIVTLDVSLVNVMLIETIRSFLFVN
jgi:hypothetical protein